MEPFSRRYNLVPEKEIQINDIDTALFNRLWNIFYNNEANDNLFEIESSIGAVEYLLDFFGLTYIYPKTTSVKDDNIILLKNFLLDTEWYYIYDFIEKYVQYFDDAYSRKDLEKKINQVLIEEKSGYRMIKGFITPITNEDRAHGINQAPEVGIYIEGLPLEGAKWDLEHGKLAECEQTELISVLPIVHLCPTQNKNLYDMETTFECTMYRMQNRGSGALGLPNYIMSIFIPTPDVPPDHWIERSVAVFITVQN